MTNKILSNVIDPEVLWKVKKTLTPCINAFSDYFLNSEEMSVLQLKFINLCKNSDLENEQIRPMAWKIFLKVLPSSENSYLKSWIEKTISDRQKFENIKLKENINSIKYKGDPLTNIANNDNKDDTWDKFFNGHKLKEIIEKDINRTFQNLKLFQDNYVRELLTDILFYWCVQPENKTMSYRQGMNDLLSILFFAFFPFYFSINVNNKTITNKKELYTKEEKERLISYTKDPTKNARHIYLFFHDEKYIAHDLFTIFSYLMSCGIKKLYETPYDMANNSHLIQEDFLNFKIEEKEIDIVYKRALDIYHNMLRNYDQELFGHLIKNKIDPTTYMVRWLRCLFCREFSYKVCIQLWDIILIEEFFQSDKKFQFVDYICVSMYENVRGQIMANGEEEILKLLFRYPQVDSPLDLIKNAYKIRSFFEFSQYQNQGINQSNANNKEAKIDLNNKKINVNNNKNKISKMTKKEKEVYDFDKKDINQNSKNVVNTKKKNNYINTDFQANYSNLPNNKEGLMLQKMSIVQKLKNIEKKYEKLLQMEDDEDLKFIINELHSKFKLK